MNNYSVYVRIHLTRIDGQSDILRRRVDTLPERAEQSRLGHVLLCRHVKMAVAPALCGTAMDDIPSSRRTWAHDNHSNRSSYSHGRPADERTHETSF